MLIKVRSERRRTVNSITAQKSYRGICETLLSSYHTKTSLHFTFLMEALPRVHLGVNLNLMPSKVEKCLHVKVL